MAFLGKSCVLDIKCWSRLVDDIHTTEGTTSTMRGNFRFLMHFMAKIYQ